MGRYVKRSPRCIKKYRRQSNVVEVNVDVDSEWAGDRASRKSTLCSVIRHGVNVIKTQVNAMKSLSLSSGEAEYAAIGKGACQGLGVQSMAADWGICYK